ncbi:MAG: M1 family aminopeptidase [Bacteroidota bacterium]
MNIFLYRLSSIRLLITALAFLFLSNATKANEISAPLLYSEQAFDVLHYEAALDFTEAPSTAMKGVCTITVLWKQSPDSNKFFFHLRGLKIDTITYEGVAVIPVEKETVSSATYHWEITPPDVSKKDTAKIRIRYSGSMTGEPGSQIWGGVQTRDSILFAMGVGFYNNYISSTQHWLPCYDLPSDKATFDLKFAVKPGYVVASTGILNIIHPDNDTDVYEWKTDIPCATYLNCFAVAKYAISNDKYGDLPIQIFYLPKDSNATKYGYKLVPRMIQAFESRFGKYPFEKVGYVNTPIGSMEHQTMVSFDVDYLKRVFNTKDSLNMVAAHELAHQWFGDMVTCRDFRDTWLNEGFATYCESIYREYLFGFPEYLRYQSIKINDYFNIYISYEGVLPLYDYSRKRPSSNYPGTIYNKGSAVLGMLRYELGDSLFFVAMNEYIKSYKYGDATSEDFQKSCETVSGKDLDWFFKQWVYGIGAPSLKVDVYKKPASVSGFVNTLIKVSQVQKTNYGIYTKLPVEFSFTLNDNSILNKTFSMINKDDEFILDSIPDFKAVNINQGPTVRALLDIYSISTSVAENPEIQVSSVELTPNPADDTIKIRFNSMQNTKGNINIFDVAGRKVLENKLFCYVGDNQECIDTSELESGMYFLMINIGNYSQSISFRIIH